MARYLVDLHIPADELLRYYRGAASTVAAWDRYGRRLRFPAAVLRPFVTPSGVRGTFELEVDRNNRLQGIRRAPGP